MENKDLEKVEIIAEKIGQMTNLKKCDKVIELFMEARAFQKELEENVPFSERKDKFEARARELAKKFVSEALDKKNENDFIQLSVAESFIIQAADICL